MGPPRPDLNSPLKGWVYLQAPSRRSLPSEPERALTKHKYSALTTEVSRICNNWGQNRHIEPGWTPDGWKENVLAAVTPEGWESLDGTEQGKVLTFLQSNQLSSDIHSKCFVSACSFAGRRIAHPCSTGSLAVPVSPFKRSGQDQYAAAVKLVQDRQQVLAEEDDGT